MDAHHVIVLGDSGSGKTTHLRAMHDAFGDRTGGTSMWLNHVGERVPGRRVGGFEGLREAVAEGVPAVDYRGAAPGAMVTHARSVAYHEAERPLQIIVDEAQAVLDSDSELNEGLHRDRDEGVKWVVSTQDPGDVLVSGLKQARHYVWVGEPAMFHSGIFNYLGLPRDELPDERFRYAVIDKSGTVVYRGETDPDMG